MAPRAQWTAVILTCQNKDSADAYQEGTHTVKPCLTATSVLRSPPSGHFIEYLLPP